MSGDDQEDPRLAKLVSEVRKSIIGTQEESGEILEIAATVETAFRKQWESPPLEQMELVLRKRMVLEESRQVFPPSQANSAMFYLFVSNCLPASNGTYAVTRPEISETICCLLTADSLFPHRG
jgi:hypothetical protein